MSATLDAAVAVGLARIEALRAAAKGRRVLVGIAGSPGSGKTTLALALTARLGPMAAHLPMDGFHLADSELARLGRSDRKGAPDTFDVAGYRAMLDRVRGGGDTVWAPAFDRELEQPIAGSIAVEPDVAVVVSEGNYLLLPQPGWRAVAARFDEVWFCRTAETVRLRRLIARHEQFGKSPAAAQAWARGPDQRNAELVQASQPRAALVLDLDT
ncbi:MAG: frcK [Frankiales bacterium]|nr:frcK [Frankiales bacterium]